MSPLLGAARATLCCAVLGCYAPISDQTEATAATTETSWTQPVGTETSAGAGVLTLTDASNYRFVGLLDGPSYPVQEGADISVSWAALADDIQCHAVDPVGDIDNIALMVFPYLSEAEVEEGLSEDSLTQVDLGVYLSHEPGDATQAVLSDLTFFGTPADIQTELFAGSGAWMLLLTTGIEVGIGALTFAFIEPDPDSSQTTVSLDQGCGVLDYTADLSSAEPVAVSGVPWLDWSGVTTSGQGLDFQRLDVTEVMVARYADLSPAELETQFLDLEQLADDFWTLEHASGTAADLSQLVNRDDGSAFSGFDGSEADGTWLVALRCAHCANPAPLYLAVLEPSTQDPSTTQDPPPTQE